MGLVLAFLDTVQARSLGRGAPASVCGALRAAPPLRAAPGPGEHPPRPHPCLRHPSPRGRLPLGEQLPPSGPGGRAAGRGRAPAEGAGSPSPRTPEPRGGRNAPGARASAGLSRSRLPGKRDRSAARAAERPAAPRGQTRGSRPRWRPTGPAPDLAGQRRRGKRLGRGWAGSRAGKAPGGFCSGTRAAAAPRLRVRLPREGLAHGLQAGPREPLSRFRQKRGASGELLGTGPVAPGLRGALLIEPARSARVDSETDQTPKAAVSGSRASRSRTPAHECRHVCAYARVEPYTQSPTEARREGWVSGGARVQRRPESLQGRMAKAMPSDCVGVVRVSSSTRHRRVCTPRGCCQLYRDGTASLQVGSGGEADFQRYLTFASQSGEWSFPHTRP